MSEQDNEAADEGLSLAEGASLDFPNRAPATRESLLGELRATIDRLEADNTAIGDLKILSRSLKELRYSFKVFSEYRDRKKVTVFGSARLPEGHPAFEQARAFGKRLAEQGWMVLTGAGGGIMEAAHLGAGREMSMGVNILLPFEQRPNPVIEGDRKLISLRYFFTRKLLFVKEVDAIVLFDGGFGTMDEGFETLTLVQTGKRDLMPIVLVDAPGGTFWRDWREFVEHQLVKKGLISPEDMALFHVTDDLEEAIAAVLGFYRIYHSMRFIRDRLILRLHGDPSDELLERLNRDFGDMLLGGQIERTEAHPYELDDPSTLALYRLRLKFNRRCVGRLRQMVDVLNAEVQLPPRPEASQSL